MSANRKRPAGNGARSDKSATAITYPHFTAQTRQAPAEPSAWLRGRISTCQGIWAVHGYPTGLVATLTDRPDECSRCGARDDLEPLRVYVTRGAAEMVIMGMLCPVCINRERVTP